MVTGFALVAAGALAFNTFFVFLPNHLVATSDRLASSALLTAMLGLVVAAAAALSLGRPLGPGGTPSGRAGVDRDAGRRQPCRSLSRHSSGSLLALVLAQAFAGAVIGGVLSISMLAEMFPTPVRGTGLGLTAGLATAIAGGTAPLVDQVLFRTTGLELAPAVYVAAVAAIAGVTLWPWPETAFRDLDPEVSRTR